MSITPQAIQDLLDELEASKQARLRAWWCFNGFGQFYVTWATSCRFKVIELLPDQRPPNNVRLSHGFLRWRARHTGFVTTSVTA